MTSLPTITRRRLLALGAGAAAGVFAGFSPRRADAVLRLDVTQGNLQPMPIAVPDFIGAGLPGPSMARGVTQIIASNLQRSGLFAPIDQAAYIERISNIDTVRFPVEARLYPTEPGVQVLVHSQRPAEPEPPRGEIVMVHGLEGSSESGYMRSLAQAGWAQGRKLQIELRSGGADHSAIERYAAELVELKPDLILGQTTPRCQHCSGQSEAAK